MYIWPHLRYHPLRVSIFATQRDLLLVCSLRLDTYTGAWLEINQQPIPTKAGPSLKLSYQRPSSIRWVVVIWEGPRRFVL